MTKVQKLNQPNTVALVCSSNVQPSSSIYLSSECLALKESGFEWLFDIISSYQALPRFTNSPQVFYTLHARAKDGLTQLLATTPQGQKIASALLPLRPFSGSSIDLVAEDNTIFFRDR